MKIQHARKRQIITVMCSAMMLSLFAMPHGVRADDGSKGKPGSKGIVIGTPIIVHDPPKKKSH